MPQHISHFIGIGTFPHKKNKNPYSEHHLRKAVQWWSIALSLLFHGPV